MSRFCNTSRWVIGFSTVTLFLVAATQATRLGTGSSFEIERTTFPASAGAATGGDFEVAFSVDAIPSTSATGGEFSFTGSVWVESPPGDCAYDGVVSLIDYSQLALCMSGPATDIVSTACACFDLSRDRLVDLRDVAVFQREFTHE